MPRITVALDVMERELRTDPVYLLGDQLTLADFFVLPTMTSLSMTPEGQEMLKSRPRIGAWRARMEAQPAVTKVRATVAPHIGKPVEHHANGSRHIGPDIERQQFTRRAKWITAFRVW